MLHRTDLEEERILSQCYNLVCGTSLMGVVCFLIVLGCDKEL